MIHSLEDEPESSNQLRAAAAYTNSFISMTRSTQSTGFQVHSMRYESALNPRVSSDIASAFLVNTRLVRGDRETEHSVTSYFGDVAATMISMSGQRQAAGSVSVPLPRAAPMRLALTETLARRRSVRSYTGDGLNMSYLSAILAAAAGVTGTPSVQLQGSGRLALKFRSVASAGGLFPVDLIFVALSIKGLSRGIYQYRTNGHALELIADDSAVVRLLNCFAVPEEAISIRRSCGIVLLIGQPWRVMRKYGARGMRFVFMEAGAIAQNVALACTALGYGSVDCASVYDDEVHEVLGIDGRDVALLHAIVVGCPG